MRSHELFFLLITLSVALALIHPSLAQNSQQDYINAHNQARAQVGVGPLTWDNNLATYADNYAKKRLADCNLIHSGGPYGENLAWGSGDGVAAVQLWVNEKADYDHASNTCRQGKECRHYTQVVWRNTARVGCAREQCNNGSWFVICSYDPRGNIIGQSPY